MTNEGFTDWRLRDWVANVLEYFVFLILPLNPLVTRHSSLVTRQSSLVTRHSSIVTRHSSLVTRHSSLVTRHSSLVTRHSPLATRRWRASWGESSPRSTACRTS